MRRRRRNVRRAAKAVAPTVCPGPRRAAPRIARLGEVGLQGLNVILPDVARRKWAWWKPRWRTFRTRTCTEPPAALYPSSRSRNRRRPRPLRRLQETPDDVPISFHRILALSLTLLRTSGLQIAGGWHLPPPKQGLLHHCPLVHPVDLPQLISYKAKPPL